MEVATEYLQTEHKKQRGKLCTCYTKQMGSAQEKKKPLKERAVGFEHVELQKKKKVHMRISYKLF